MCAHALGVCGGCTCTCERVCGVHMHVGGCR